MKILILFGFILSVFFSAQVLFTENQLIKIPKGFPALEIPEDNKFTRERIILGQKLFFDTILSRDSSLSCASCHNPKLAFTDGLKKSIGINQQELLRNSPTLTNVGYQTNGLLMEGGVPTLEMQILVPVQEHNEFDFNLDLIAERMKQDPEYVRLSKIAYNSIPNQYVITRAIACFERTLLSGDSKYDKFINGDQNAFSESEKRGYKLFSEKLECTKCHSGFNLTDLSARNNGLYPYPYPLDSGKMRLTKMETDRDKFKVPTLRNIAVTSPYMHDGSLNSLDDVINHYSAGGFVHKNKDSLIKAFDISINEKQDLINFLHTLTDSSFLTNWPKELN